jgi:tetratricopeptide (TPR) repeat protein
LLSSLAAFGQFEDPETAMRRGDTALGQGRFDVAQSIYERTLRSSPNVNLGVNRCRNIAAANLRATHPNVKAGVDWLQRAVELAPNDNALRQHFADVLLNTSESTRAATQYRNLLAKDPEN